MQTEQQKHMVSPKSHGSVGRNDPGSLTAPQLGAVDLAESPPDQPSRTASKASTAWRCIVGVTWL
jgi:hypothetical protein